MQGQNVLGSKETMSTQSDLLCTSSVKSMCAALIKLKIGKMCENEAAKQLETFADVILFCLDRIYVMLNKDVLPFKVNQGDLLRQTRMC